MDLITVEPLRDVQAELKRLIDEQIAAPATRSAAPDANAAWLVRHHLEQAARHPRAQAWSARSSSACAVALLQPLDWDTRLLGMSAGRVDLLASGPRQARAQLIELLLHTALEEAAGHGIRHLTTRADASDDALMQGLERRGFLNVDALLVFEAPTPTLLERTASAAAAAAIRPVTAADCGAVSAIAEGAFRRSRFHSDPFIPADRVGGVFREWAAGCCNGSAADAVLVADVSGEVGGFVACRMVDDPAVQTSERAGTIPLIACAAGARGRGLGSALVAAAASWFNQQGAHAVTVGTQLSNVPAARLYEKCGFRLKAGALSFSMMLDA